MYLLLFVGVLCWSLFDVHYLLSFLLLQSDLDEEERAGCLAFNVFQVSQALVTVNVLWLFLTVPWLGLQFVIVVFPNHTHFFIVSS